MYALTPSLSKQGHNSRMEKVVNSEIDLSLPYMVPHLLYKFSMIYFNKGNLSY